MTRLLMDGGDKKRAEKGRREGGRDADGTFIGRNRDDLPARSAVLSTLHSFLIALVVPVAVVVVVVVVDARRRRPSTTSLVIKKSLSTVASDSYNFPGPDHNSSEFLASGRREMRDNDTTSY